jgi:hypothetical protein
LWSEDHAAVSPVEAVFPRLPPGGKNAWPLSVHLAIASGCFFDCSRAAGTLCEWDAQHEVGTLMQAFAQALKQDPQLD